MYIWDLTITEPEGFYYVFQAENDDECCFMIEATDIVSGTIVNVINLFTMQKSTVKQVSHSARRKSRTTRQGQPLILAVPTNNGYAFSRAS